MPRQTIPSIKTFWRSLHALNVTRLLIACLLFLFWGLYNPRASAVSPLLSYFNICAIYLGLSILFALYTFLDQRNFLIQLLTQIIFDIIAMALLYVVAGGVKGGMAILFLFPLASAAILLQMPLALFFASLVTIFLLSDTSLRYFGGQSDSSLTQAGLYGAAFFSAVFLLNRLASRLITQEKLATQHEQALQTQEAVNRLVISEMDDGVMVIGEDGSIFACNPAAEHMLGLTFDKRQKLPMLSEISYLKPLSDAFLTWRSAKHKGRLASVEPTAYIVIKPSENSGTTTIMGRENYPPLGTHIKARFARTASEPLPRELNVIFLQDVAKIDDQAQQLKLASMGRLTASIAHEVRNPLAAISHASALFGEDANAPSQQRLLKIVSDNVSRLNRMIEDILNLSRKAQSQELINLSEIIYELKSSFVDMHGLPQENLKLDVPDHYRVRFDPVHLREVILNLLNNALRYASGQSGCIRIFTVQPTPTRLELHVQDDGPPITPSVRAHLFEPFYTTSRHGTGLGLYLARELCSNNGAMLDYEFHPDLRNPLLSSGRFVITFSAPDITQGALSQ